MKAFRSLLWLAGLLLLDTAVSLGDPPQFFRDQVEPLLRKRCFECHSHERGTIEGKLALDWRSGWEKGGERGPAIVIGKPEESLLIQAVQHASSELRMPEEKLAADEIAILTQWVAEGAFDDRVVQPETEGVDADWWSLKPLVRPALPSDNPHPIDAFVHSRLQASGLQLSPPADRGTLIRRVSYDLTGLPPTFEEVQAFTADADPNAYAALVDRLLDSPRYGERWARHWFDTIHFADSHGYEHDIGRDHAWRYRDYVINALNNDTRWDRFIREQLAADYFYPDSSQLIPALGFLGAGTFDLSTFSTAPVTFDYLDRDDMVTQTMAALTSTTANCARCHAHKFDPITQEDYYSLQAVFAGVLKGDVAFDEDIAVARERAKWVALQLACDKQSEEVLLADEWQQAVETWVEQHAVSAKWQPLELETFLSLEGASLVRNAEGIVVASGTLPDQDTYVVSAQPNLVSTKPLTALRLNVHADDSLPMGGPGRCHNGNLHLSEVAVQVFKAGDAEGKSVKIASATADFNQAGWGIERAIDGDPKTAWGIYPAVKQTHYAVFVLAEPLEIEPDSRIAITLRQLHGGSHLIGAFSLAATCDNPSEAVAIPQRIDRALRTESNLRTREDQLVIATHALREMAEQALRKLPAKVYVYAAAANVNVPAGEGQVQVKSIPEPKLVHVLQRGDFDKPRELVSPGALSAIEQLPARFPLENPKSEAARRAALADWIAHPNNPLTWRSIVNRVWQHHFGRGLCDTPSDFGRMGGVPSHPEMLDWLAVWFRDDAHGSLKQLHRLIVTSETYQQSVASREAAQEIDAENKLLWRQNRQRLDADSVRDFTLAVSGALDLTMGGPGVQHFAQSKGPQITPALDYTRFDWSKPGAARRSIYRYVWRGIADPFMEAMDFPDLGLLSPTRSFSASSLQALTLYNNDFVLHFSQVMADEVLREASSRSDADAGDQVQLDVQTSVQASVQIAVQRAWLRSPSPEELAEFTPFVEQHGLAAFCRLLFNSNEFLFVN